MGSILVPQVPMHGSPSTRSSLSFVLSIALLSACGDDNEAGEDVGTDPGGVGTEGTETNAPTSGQASTPGSGDEASSGIDPGSDASSGEPPPPPPPADLAGDIRITDVRINQAVDIALAQDGVWLETAARTAPVIAGRPALIRVAYALEPNFVPRDLELRVHLNGGGDVRVETRSVAGPPDLSTLDGTFHVVLDANALDAQTDIAIELVEANGAATQGVAGNARLPARGASPLGAWSDMALDVVLVPFTCDGYPGLDLNAEAVANFEAFLYNTYPVETLNLTVHEPVASSSCSEFDAAEYDLPALRESEGASPWVYYGGLLPGNGGGYSISTEGGDQMDYRRTFANHAWRDYGLTSDLFAHELGHNHGRDHTFDDPGFPLETGDWCGPRSTQGWGARSAMMPSSGFSNDLDLGLAWFDPHTTLLAPTDASCDGVAEGNRYNFNDILSYTYPYWVSAYTYASLAERVRTIAAWRTADIEPPVGRTARLVVGPEGDLHRSVRHGSSAVTQPDLWAQCGTQRVGLRKTESWLETRTPDGEPVSYAYVGYELPLAGVEAPEACTVDDHGVRTRLLGADALSGP